MVSDLAAQLANINAGNTIVLDRKKRKKLHSVSLIFEPHEAVGQDYETIFSIAIEGLTDLEQLDPRFGAFRNNIFSESSISVDRLLQTSEQNQLLDNAIESFLLLVASRLNLQPAIKALEWLVRRFQAHINNAESLLLMALPYYSTPIFLRLLDTISMPLPPIFSFLNNAKKTIKNPSRNLIVRALAADLELHRLVASYIVKTISNGYEYQLLLTFWSSMSIWVILLMKEKGVNQEDIVDRFLSDLSDIIRLKKHSEAQIAAYMIFSVIGSQFQLSTNILNAAIQSIVLNWTSASQKSALAAITQIVKGRDEEPKPFEKSTWKILKKSENVPEEILAISESYNIHRFITLWALSALAYSPEDLSSVVQVLCRVEVTDSELEEILRNCIRVGTDSKTAQKSRSDLTTLFDHILKSEKKELIFKSALESSLVSFEALELSLQSSLTSRILGSSEDVEMSEEFTAVSTESNLKSEIKSLQKVSVASFFDIENNELFTERANIFSQLVPFKSLDRVLKDVVISETQAVSFFARLWCGSYPSLVRADSLKSFIELVSKNSASIDYQATIGPLLIALSDSSERVRRLAITAFAELEKNYPNKNAEIWGIDDVYGPGKKSSEVTWIASDKANLIINAINSNAEEFIVSAHSIFPFISNFLSSPDKALKTASSQFYSYLATHSTYAKTPSVKLGLLKFVNTFTKTNRSKSFETLLNSWIEDRAGYKTSCEFSKVSFVDLEAEVIDIIATGERGAGISFLESCIKSGDSELADKAGKKISSIWSTLRPDVQLVLFNFLVDFAVDGENTFDPTEVLFSIRIKTELFISVLEDCKLESGSNGIAGIPKRRRRSSGAAKQKLQSGEIATIAERHLKKTTLILEALEQNDAEGNVQLLSQLFVILGEILTLGADSTLPVNYTQQVLANCMIRVVSELKKQKNLKLDSNSMRVDIIVSCIRSSSSQQVQNRFLLLVANLATLDSDIVLHSVMPIFTFMGANTIRQDDEFSAHVIQQTITQVIPALLSSETKVEETDFLLLSFVAAFAHIPRHRRVRLFSTLVKTLGSGSALHCLLFLLGQKYFEAKQKRKSMDAKSLLQFADSFFRGFSVSDQFSTIQNFLSLINYIPLNELSDEDRQSSSPFTRRQIFSSVVDYSTANLLALRSTMIEYLASIISNEEMLSDVPSLRVTTAVLFQDSTLQSEQSAINKVSVSIIELILQTLSGLRLTSQDKESINPVVNSYHNILDAFLELLPINIFVHVFQNILLVSDNEKTRQNSVSLLRSKFELESSAEATTQEAAHTAFTILVDIVSQGAPKNISQQCFSSLEVIVLKYGNNFDPKELLKVLDLLVGNRGLLNFDVDILVSSISVISSLYSVLGARAIGYFGKIIPVLFEKFESSLPADGELPDESSELVQLATFGLIAGLVKRIPAFMTSSLVNIFKLIFISTVPVSTRQSLIQAISVGMDGKAVLSALTETWTFAVGAGWDSIALHLDSVDNVIASSERKIVASQSASLVTFLLKSFEVRGLVDRYEQNTIHRIETRTINTGIHIVMKLNDKTFRPLFVRMVRWAIEGEGCSTTLPEIARKTVFFKYLHKLFGNLKSIITGYFSYLVDPVCNILEKYHAVAAAGETSSKTFSTLRASVLSTLSVSFQYDREEFWQAQARFDKIVAALVEQIPSIEQNHGNSLVKAIVGLAETVSSPEQYKVINDSLLKHMQESCTVSEKIWAVKTMKNLYSKLGEEWVTMLPQLVPVLAELLEDDDESVEMEVRKNLVPVVEEVLGESLDRYLS